MIIKKGSTGENVEKIQIKLGLNPDGHFGSDTENAVKEWQRENGLKDDGVVGNSTWSKMFESELSSNVFNLAKLKGHVPDSVIIQIPKVALKFNITTPLRLAHFLAQCGHESGGFNAVVENLNYSSDGLKRIFGKYFPGDSAKSYARNPEKIGSKVYANRMGNGDELSKEGFRFRGRGYIQLTGKSNYKAFSDYIGEDCVNNPDLVANKYPLASAAFFFNKNNLWSICDKGSDDSIVKLVTKRVNGGTNGLTDRIKHFKEFYNLLK